MVAVLQSGSVVIPVKFAFTNNFIPLSKEIPKLMLFANYRARANKPDCMSRLSIINLGVFNLVFVAYAWIEC